MSNVQQHNEEAEILPDNIQAASISRLRTSSKQGHLPPGVVGNEVQDWLSKLMKTFNDSNGKISQ